MCELFSLTYETFITVTCHRTFYGVGTLNTELLLLLLLFHIQLDPFCLLAHAVVFDA